MERREWVYVQPPAAYEVYCDICGNRHVEWSEYQGMVWCWRCLKDTRGTGGVLDGPIPFGVMGLLGISLDRIDLKTGQRLTFKIEGTQGVYEPIYEGMLWT